MIPVEVHLQGRSRLIAAFVTIAGVCICAAPAVCQSADGVACGSQFTWSTVGTGFRVVSRPVGRGMVVSVWLDPRNGSGSLGVYCSVATDEGVECDGIPLDGLLLPKRSGTLARVIVERVAYDRVAVATVTDAGDDTDCLTWSVIQVLAPDHRPAFRVTVDSSLTCERNLSAMAVVPSDERHAWLVLQDTSPGATGIVAKKLSTDLDPALVVSQSVSVEAGTLGCAMLGACSDGDGGVIWCGIGASAGTSDPEDRLLRLYHFDRSGRQDPRWPPAGARVAPTIMSYEVQMRSDKHGGAYVSWFGTTAATLDTLRTLATRINRAGRLAPGWSAAGTVLVENFDPWSRGVELCVGEKGQLFGGVLGLYGGYLAGFDGTGRRLPGWPVEGVSLARPQVFGVESQSLVPLAGGGVIAFWGDGSSLHATKVIPSRLSSTTIEVTELPLCASTREQRLAGVNFAAPASCAVLWEEVAPPDSPSPGHGLYMAGIDLKGCRIAEPEFEMLALQRGMKGIHVDWKGAEIIDELPEVWLRQREVAPTRVGVASRLDSWRCEATIPIQCLGAGNDLEVIVRESAPDGRALGKSFVASFTESPRVVIASAIVMNGLIEVRGAVHDSQGEIQLALFDVAGRRLSTRRIESAEEGAFTLQLAAPSRAGVYWVQVRHAGQSVSRALLLER